MTADKPINIGAQKKSPLRCRRFWLRALPMLMLLSAPIYIPLILVYGNCQWCRGIYMFQRYVYPKRCQRSSSYTGVWKTWFRNGREESSCSYRDGTEHGTTTYRYPNSQKKYECHYRMGRLHGSYTHWGKTGNINVIGYYEDSVLIRQAWYSSGRKSYEENYKNGKKHGQCTTWHGKVTAVKHYEDGRLVRFDHYIGNKLSWTEEPVEWDAEGNVIKAKRRTWYSNGQLMVDGQSMGWKPFGRWTYWHPNGQKKFDLKFADGKYDGIYKEWNDEGKLIFSGVYRGGKPWDGSFRIHHKKEVHIYKQGELIRTEKLEK